MWAFDWCCPTQNGWVTTLSAILLPDNQNPWYVRRAESNAGVYEWVRLHGVFKEGLLCAGPTGSEIKHAKDPLGLYENNKVNIFLSLSHKKKKKNLPPRGIKMECQKGVMCGSSKENIYLTLSLNSSGRYYSIALPDWCMQWCLFVFPCDVQWCISRSVRVISAACGAALLQVDHYSLSPLRLSSHCSLKCSARRSLTHYLLLCCLI